MNKKKLCIILIIIVLIILSFLGGSTIAKYRTVNSQIGQLHVAKWRISNRIFANGVSNNSNKINLATTYDPKTLVNGKIAPGTSGNFGAHIDAHQVETGVDYSISFANIPESFIENILFSYNGKTYKDLQTLSEDLRGNIPANATNKILDITIDWIWPYETFDSENSCVNEDIEDTEYASYDIYQKCEFDIILTMTQEKPEKLAETI